MKINYRRFEDYKSVDIEKLRPKNSYKDLFEKRTHSIDRLVEKYGKIPDELLIKRNCPTCDSKDSSISMEKDYMCIVSNYRCI